MHACQWLPPGARIQKASETQGVVEEGQVSRTQAAGWGQALSKARSLTHHELRTMNILLEHTL